MFFLMVVCHQPYSEINNIPFTEAVQMLNQFSDILKMFSSKKSITNKINYAREKIKLPEEIYPKCPKV
jgi:hypothetical protein